MKKAFKKIIIVFYIISIFFTVNCVHSVQSRVTPGINLNGFRYVHVPQLTYPDGSVDQYGIRAKVITMFRDEGFTILAENQIPNIGPEELGQVLYCTINHFHTGDGLGGSYATVVIECLDLLNRQVFYSKGKNQGLTIQDDLDGAVKLAMQNFSLQYTGFNPAYSINIAKELQDKYADWEKIDFNEQQLIEYFDKNASQLHQIEGIWSELELKQYKIGIFKEENLFKRDFVAIILESNSPYWIPKQVKIEFDKTAYSSAYSATYYLNDHSKQGTTAIITDEGILEFNLKNPDGTEFKARFIKNYPSFSSSGLEGHSVGPISAGSGFLVDSSGLVATNYHIVSDKSDIEVFFPEINKSYKASIALKDSKNDIAILRILDFVYSKVYSENIPYSISTSKSIKLGESIFTLGFPLGEVLGRSPKFSTGTISYLFGIQDDPRLYQISNPIQPGNSGSPLFNDKGQLVGVVVASINAKYLYEKADILPQNVNFAIKSDYLINLLSMLPEGDRVLKRNSRLMGKKLEDQIKMITPYILQIKAK